MKGLLYFLMGGAGLTKYLLAELFKIAMVFGKTMNSIQIARLHSFRTLASMSVTG